MHPVSGTEHSLQLLDTYVYLTMKGLFWANVPHVPYIIKLTVDKKNHMDAGTTRGKYRSTRATWGSFVKKLQLIGLLDVNDPYNENKRAEFVTT